MVKKKSKDKTNFPKKLLSDNLAGALSAACLLTFVTFAYFAPNWLACFAAFLIGVTTSSFMAYARYKSKYSGTFISVLLPGILVALLLTQPGPINTFASAVIGAVFVLSGTTFRGKIPDLNTVKIFIIGE